MSAETVPENNFQATLGAFWYACRNYGLAVTLAWNEVAQRYKRSSLGAFWLTLNMAVLILALGFVFGSVLRTPLNQFLPFLCLGLILWGFISSAVNEGATAFVSHGQTILHLPVPLFLIIIKVFVRNVIVLAHNILIVPILFLFFRIGVKPVALLAIPGFMLLSLNLLWVTFSLAIVCARYRDLPQVVQNLLQIAFYVTPIIWMPYLLPGGYRRYLLNLNPAYHLMNLVRDPILGTIPPQESWIWAIGLAIFGWLAALALFNRYRLRVAYWI